MQFRLLLPLSVSVAITSLVKVPLKRVQIQVKKRVFNQETVFIQGVDAATAVKQGGEIAFEDARLMAFF